MGYRLAFISQKTCLELDSEMYSGFFRDLTFGQVNESWRYLFVIPVDAVITTREALERCGTVIKIEHPSFPERLPSEIMEEVWGMDEL